MSSDGPSFDPFGRNDRTIIRPNPARRRSQAPLPSPAITSGPPSASAAAPMADEWATTPEFAPRVADLARREVAPDLQQVELIMPSENPLMRAAGPLLLLLGRLRVALLRAPLA